MLEENNDLKIIDFGLSKKGLSNLSSKVGSPFYVAPEVLLKNQYGPNVDIWAIGVIMYKLITGEVPFKSRETAPLFEEITNFKLDLNHKHFQQVSE
jgi:serine/threonine protein kinase